MAGFPKWATPHRKAQLVNLFLRSGGFCVFGHRPCPNPNHHYQLYIEGLIGDWVADDRAQAEAEWRALERAMHGLAERKPERGQFNATAKDAYYAQQPQYYLDGLGVSGLTFRAFAKVRLASSYVNLLVDIAGPLKGASKARRRKAIRYGKALPAEVQEKVDQVCGRAVRHYLAQS
jgi:hypothetical protein